MNNVADCVLFKINYGTGMQRASVFTGLSFPIDDLRQHVPLLRPGTSLRLSQSAMVFLSPF